MNLISQFDPWRSALCTCPSKLTFNPYTGCDHGCIYCYASSYIPRFHECRPKKNLIHRLNNEASKLKGEILSMSNSSDPYPTIDARTSLTRECLKILCRHQCRLQIITKSDLVIRDIDLLTTAVSMVSMTITTDDDEIAKTIEPNAPPPSRRLNAIEKLVQKDVPVAVRIDPVIPFVNDNLEILVEKLAVLGVKHITSSTFKVKAHTWKRFSQAMPTEAEKLRHMYFEKGERIAGYVYLPTDLRTKVLDGVRWLTEKYGIKFGTCREGLPFLNTATCDGSWMLLHEH